MNLVQQVGRAVDVPLELGARGLSAIGNVSAQGYALVSTRVAHFNKGQGWGIRIANTRWDYRASQETAAQNTAVVAVVGWLARNFPEAPVRITKPQANDDDPLEFVPKGLTGPGAMLRLLERPNKAYSGVLQWMATILDWCYTGNAYWIKVRGGNDRVVALWWAPSWMMEPRWDTENDNSFIDWYEYTVEGTVYKYRPQDIVHFRDGIDPNNVRKGLSKLALLLREIYTDDEASNFTASLMRNLGVPGVIIAPANTNGPMGRFKDPEEVKTSFMEKFGGDKRGEPFVASIPTEIKVLSFSPQQMDLRSLRKVPEERISAIYGVAAIVAGLGAGLDRSTFANYGEARKAAYEEAVIPAQRLFGAELEVQLLPDFTGPDPEFDVWFDAKMAGAMQEAAEAVWKRNQEAAVKGLIKRKDFKKAVGLPVEDGDDVYILPSNFLILSPSEKPPLPQPKQIGPGPSDGPPDDRPPGGRPKQIPARTTLEERLWEDVHA